jgi:hypothetical protein
MLLYATSIATVVSRRSSYRTRDLSRITSKIAVMQHPG